MWHTTKSFFLLPLISLPLIFAAGKPTIEQLIDVNKRDGTRLRIIDTFTAHRKLQLENFADILLNDTIKVRKLKKKYADDDDFIHEVLKYWLTLDDDDPGYPRTWKALENCISKAGLDGTFAKAIRETYYPDPPAGVCVCVCVCACEHFYDYCFVNF